MASHFPEAGNLNARNANMYSDVAGPSSSGSGDLFELSGRSNTTCFYYFPTTSTTGRHLGFERDYNYHTAFRACYVIMHKVYWLPIILTFSFLFHRIYKTGQTWSLIWFWVRWPSAPDDLYCELKWPRVHEYNYALEEYVLVTKILPHFKTS